jgi:hypothetical protein
MADSIINIEFLNVREAVFAARVKQRLLLSVAAMALGSLFLIFTVLI